MSKASTPPQDSTQSLFDVLNTRTRPTLEQKTYMEARGLDHPYWNMEPYDAVRRLMAVGLTPDQVVDLMDLPDDETLIVASKVVEDLPAIADLNARGFTVLEISNKTGLPRPTVYYHINSLDLVPNRYRAQELTISQERRIVKLRTDGFGLKIIQQRVGCSYDQVRAAIRRAS